MSKTILGSQKFSSLEIVDSAKFDNEIVFSDLSMSGESLNIVSSKDLSITSTGTSSPWGINILSVGPITSSSTNGKNLILSGFSSSSVKQDGNVSIGHSTEGDPISQIEVVWDSLSEENRIGFFGTAPVKQPILPLDDLNSLIAALRSLGLIAP